MSRSCDWWFSPIGIIGQHNALCEWVGLRGIEWEWSNGQSCFPHERNTETGWYLERQQRTKFGGVDVRTRTVLLTPFESLKAFNFEQERLPAPVSSLQQSIIQ